jgi:hypothetical protein
MLPHDSLPRVLNSIYYRRCLRVMAKRRFPIAPNEERSACQERTFSSTMSNFRFAILVTTLLPCFGCDHKSKGVAVAEVSGRVTIDQKALEWGTVIFTPAQGRSSTGMIQPDGTYKLTTFSDGDGAVVGAHDVAVICTDQKPVPSGGFVEVGKISKWLIPKRYGEPSSSGLKFTVVADEDNVANFDLKSQ